MKNDLGALLPTSWNPFATSGTVKDVEAEDLEQALQMANEKTEKLNVVQTQVDEMLEELKYTDYALYEKMKQKRDASRSWFNNYVMPLYNGLMELLGLSPADGETMGFSTTGYTSDPAAPSETTSLIQTGPTAIEESDSSMGALPLIPVAIAAAGIGATLLGGAALTAVIAYYKEVQHNIKKEEDILNDPAIPQSVKFKVAMRTKGLFGALEEISTQVKWIVGIGSVGLITILLLKRKKK